MSKHPKSLIVSTRVDANPKFSPDGKHIVFISGRSGTVEIWVCDQDGANAMQLTSLGASITGSPRQYSGRRAPGLRLQSRRTVRALPGQPECRASSAPDQPSRRRCGSELVARWAVDLLCVQPYWRAADLEDAQGGGGEAVQLTKRGGYVAFASPDGKFVYYSRNRVGPLMKVPVQGGDETQVLESVTFQNFAVVGKGIYSLPEAWKQAMPFSFLISVTERSGHCLRSAGPRIGGSPFLPTATPFCTLRSISKPAILCWSRIPVGVARFCNDCPHWSGGP